ncbi:MAG: hypothetical protein GVY28_08545 [Alphaproteobacteria bacterium]|jgi:urease accessory protein|nr:hypothetical protein [Alphaproteobacteria bacterium]
MLTLLAHAADGAASFSAGFWHPLHGLDHLLAMVTVGFLSARMQPRRMWTLPAAFVSFMLLGGLLGLVWASEGLAAIEWGISLSVLVFGLFAALAPRVNVWLGNAVVAVFAICHGHAHIAEMGGASVAAYFAGMLIATGLLHIGGLGAGVVLRRQVGDWIVRLAGGAVAAGFVPFIIGWAG